MGHLFIQTFQENPTLFFSVIITVVISIILHELAHGWMAIRLGDDTPALTGHMTLNPLVHMGITSLLMLALFGIAFGAMPVDRTRLRGKYAESYVAVAGPVMNLLLGLLGLVGLGLWLRFGKLDTANHVQMNAFVLLSVFGPTNIALMLFNLLPIPPLDGSKIAANLIPAYRQFVSSDVARGVMSALFFAMFLGGATFIYDAADAISTQVIVAVAGRGEVREAAPAADDQDDANAAPPDATPNPAKPQGQRR